LLHNGGEHEIGATGCVDDIDLAGRALRMDWKGTAEPEASAAYQSALENIATFYADYFVHYFLL
jgi:hypothetical protein